MSINMHFVFKLFALAACATAACSAAQAADNTRYISITGNNADACTLAKPCRTLQRGINVTPAGGELRILDSGFYGNNATINKSLTITGNGNTVFLGKRLNIDEPGAVVALRDLTLNGEGKITVGVRVFTVAVVHIESCVFHGFTSDGIFVNAPGVEVYVIDSTSRDNGLAGLYVGLGIARISNSTFTNNNRGIENGGGTIETRENNTVRGNTTNVTGSLTPFNGV